MLRLAKCDRGQLSGTQLFFYQHAIGLAIVLPLAAIVDGADCIIAVRSKPGAVWFAFLSATSFFAYNRYDLLDRAKRNADTHAYIV